MINAPRVSRNRVHWRLETFESLLAGRDRKDLAGVLDHAAVSDTMDEGVARAAARPHSLAFRFKVTWLAALALHGLVAWLYIWFGTGGTFRFASRLNYYDLLADGFLAGQLHLKVSPAPELLALPDPYDAEQNRPYRQIDLSLYDGRYYLYFGPVPGLFHALWKGLTGLPAHNSATGVLFGLGGCLGFWLLARELRDRAFPGTSDALVVLVYLCYAIGGVSLLLQANPTVYVEAIQAGSFFALAGSYFWLRALSAGPSAGWLLALAGFLYGCGFGSRFVMIGYPLAAGLVLVWRWHRAPHPQRWPAARQIVLFSLPLAAILGLVVLYNYVRFASFTEFGATYQLFGRRDWDTKLDLRFVPLNLAAHLFFVPRFLPYYPFQESRSCYEDPSPYYAWGGGVDGWCLDAPFASTLLLAPLAILAPFACLLLTPLWRGPDRSVRAFVVASWCGVLCSLGVLLTFHTATARYMQDFLPFACLLGALACWWLRPAQRAHWLWRSAYGVLCAALLLTSVSLGLSTGMSQLADGQPLVYLRLGYRFDSAMAGLLQRMAPSAWPSTYLADEVKGRRRGIFYPEQTRLMLTNPSGRIESLELWSLLPAATRVTVEIDGRAVGEGRLQPGRQSIPLRVPQRADRNGEAAVRLRFPDEARRPPGYLWPVAVGALRGPAQADSASGR
jgi:hypothetical protein